MKYYSEVLSKYYDTAEKCLAAEKAYEEKAAAMKAHEEELAAKRKERAKEVDTALEKACEAYKHYKDVLDQFVKDYGSFHTSISGENDPYDILFRLIFNAPI